jgi:hypothetical protein
LRMSHLVQPRIVPSAMPTPPCRRLRDGSRLGSVVINQWIFASWPVKFLSRYMKAFEPYVAQLGRLATRTLRNPAAVPAEEIAAALDGQASVELRKAVSTKQLREAGAFFTGSELADWTLNPVHDLGRQSIVLDPGCGAGARLSMRFALAECGPNFDHGSFDSEIPERDGPTTDLTSWAHQRGRGARCTSASSSSPIWSSPRSSTARSSLRRRPRPRANAEALLPDLRHCASTSRASSAFQRGSRSFVRPAIVASGDNPRRSS